MRRSPDSMRALEASLRATAGAAKAARYQNDANPTDATRARFSATLLAFGYVATPEAILDLLAEVDVLRRAAATPRAVARAALVPLREPTETATLDALSEADRRVWATISERSSAEAEQFRSAARIAAQGHYAAAEKERARRDAEVARELEEAGREFLASLAERKIGTRVFRYRRKWVGMALGEVEEPGNLVMVPDGEIRVSVLRGDGLPAARPRRYDMATWLPPRGTPEAEFVPISLRYAEALRKAERGRADNRDLVAAVDRGLAMAAVRSIAARAHALRPRLQAGEFERLGRLTGLSHALLNAARADHKEAERALASRFGASVPLVHLAPAEGQACSRPGAFGLVCVALDGAPKVVPFRADQSLGLKVVDDAPEAWHPLPPAPA